MPLMIVPLVSLLTACGGEKVATPVAAAGPKLTADADVPDDAQSKAFALTLISADTTDFSPSDASGAKFEYTRFSFRGDNTWVAEGYVEAMDERMDCTESGTWSMSAAESANKASMNWTVTKTNCAGRDNGSETRVLVTVGKSGIESAMFR